MRKTTISLALLFALTAGACSATETNTDTTIGAVASVDDTTTGATAPLDPAPAGTTPDVVVPEVEFDPTTMDACLVFDTTAAEALLGRALESTEQVNLQAPPGAGCRWDAGWVDKDGGSYRVMIRLDVYAFPLSEMVSGEGCVQAAVPDLGDEAISSTCDGISGGPASHTLAVHKNGISVLLAVLPDRDVSAQEVRAEMDRILAEF